MVENNNRQRCEVYSRVVGYLRPVRQWNDGKQEEFADRLCYTGKTTKSRIKKGTK